MKKVLLIINPVSGRMKSKKTLFDIVYSFSKRDYSVVVSITTHKGHAFEIVENEEIMNYDLLVCCGGDGTLNEVVSAVLKSKKKVPLGYIPSGSTNDFANSLNLSGNFIKATNNIIDGKPIELDIGMFNYEKYFTYIASFGAFTAASYNATQSTKNTFGHLAYVLEGVKELNNIKPYRIKVKSDEIALDNNYIFGAVTNTTSVGGIVKIGPNIVDMSDGIFEVIMIKAPKSVFDLNKIMAAITNSNFQNNELIDFFKTKKVEFDFDKKIPWSLDGEFESGNEKVVIENKNKAYTLMK